MASLAEHAVPEHVPEHLVYDFHLFGDERYIADPYARALEVIEQAPPIFWSLRGQCWYVARYPLIMDITKRPELFSNELRPGMPDDFVYLPAPQNQDPPKHTQFAAPLKAAFSPMETMKYEKAIRELAVQCIEPLAGKGECEFIGAVAEPLPILMFLKIMGVPFDRFAQFRGLALETLNAPDELTMFNKMIEVDALMTGYIEARRNDPQGDVISRLWKAEIDGRPINLDEMRRYGLMLFTAGLDSVTNGLGHSMHHLARHPGLQARLVEEPKLIHAATEELLRRYGVTTPPRRLHRDTVYEGVEMRKDDKVELWLIAGNLDADAFADPTEVIVGRSERTHLTFGFGIHRCIGAHLARLELHVLYEEWLKRIPTMRLDPDRRATYDPGHVLRITNLPLKWDV